MAQFLNLKDQKSYLWNKRVQIIFFYKEKEDTNLVKRTIAFFFENLVFWNFS